MKRFFWILPVFMAATLSVSYLLPEVGGIAESAAIMDLPEKDGEWIYQARVASEVEVKVLGKETDFSKATCYRPRPGEYTQDGRRIPEVVDVSIVLSGSDLNTSIHRPERCMPAQGHVILDSRGVKIRLPSGDGFRAKRLQTSRRVHTGEKGAKPMKVKSLTYYFFVGRNRVTNDHVKRTLIDMKDRLVHGTDQRWAYVSVSMMYGELPWMGGKEVPVEEADAKLQEFLSRFAERQIDWERIRG